MHFTFGSEEAGVFSASASEFDCGRIAPSPKRSTKAAAAAPTAAAPQTRRKPLLTMADLSQFDNFQKARPIAIPQASPFASSTVATPPLGFSMRGKSCTGSPPSYQHHPMDAKRWPVPDYRASPEPQKQKHEHDPLPRPDPETQRAAVAPLRPNNDVLRAKPRIREPGYAPPQVRAQSMFGRIQETKTRLTGESGLVYPDGHFSPVNTPRTGFQ